MLTRELSSRSAKYGDPGRMVDWLTRQKRFSFRDYRLSLLSRTVETRMLVCGIERYDAYLARIQSDPEEIHALPRA
jgi:chemotaxis methyl-accepting protein methylase